MKIKARVVETNMIHISIFSMRKPTDKILNSVSVSMDTEIAKYLEHLVNTDQRRRDELAQQ